MNWVSTPWSSFWLSYYLNLWRCMNFSIYRVLSKLLRKMIGLSNSLDVGLSLKRILIGRSSFQRRNLANRSTSCNTSKSQRIPRNPTFLVSINIENSFGAWSTLIALSEKHWVFDIFTFIHDETEKLFDLFGKSFMISFIFFSDCVHVKFSSIGFLV